MSRRQALQSDDDEDDDPFGRTLLSSDDDSEDDGGELSDTDEASGDQPDGSDSDAAPEFSGLQTDEDSEDGDGSGSGSASDVAGFGSDSDGSGSDSSDGEQSDGQESGLISLANSKKSGDLSGMGKLLAGSQQNAGVSASRQSDAQKGEVVRSQRKAFDAILAMRIKLQNAIISTNNVADHIHEERAKGRNAAKVSGSTSKDGDTEPKQAKFTPATKEALRGAQTAALSLWSSLDQLRENLSLGRDESSGNSGNNSKSDKKRKRPVSDPEEVWARMESYESSILSHRQRVLTKWFEKTRPSDALRSSRLRPTSNKGSTQSVTDMLSAHLAMNLPNLVQRTRIPRSCAPLQAANGLASSVHIFDDADFYGLLLRDLLEQRSGSTHGQGNAGSAFDPSALVSGVPDWHTLRRDINAKSKARRQAPGVDTRVSRGRKLNYAVQDKLLDFTSREPRENWTEIRSQELFASVMGKRGRLDDAEVSSDEEEQGQIGAGIRLF